MPQGNPKERITYLGELEDITRVTLFGQSDQKSLQEVIQKVQTAPDVVTTTLKNLCAETQGNVMLLIKYLEVDLGRAQKADDEEKILFNVALEDEEWIAVHGSSKTVKSLETIMAHLVEVPAVVTVFLDQLEAVVQKRKIPFMEYLEKQREELMQTFDLRTDLEDFVRLELEKFMSPADEAVTEILVQRVCRFLRPHFPILTPHLRGLSKQLRTVVGKALQEMRYGRDDNLIDRITSVEGMKGLSNPNSVFAKIHDHPSNRKSIVEA